VSTTIKRTRDEVLPVAQRLLEASRPYCERIEMAGSLRREKPMVGDIEIVAIPRPRTDLFGTPVKGTKPLDSFFAERGVEFTKNGDRYKQFQYGRHVVDLFLTTFECWGSVFTIRTGSADFSHWLVSARPRGAAPWGLTFSEGRLYAHGRRLITREEQDVFAAVGLAYIEPKLRSGPVGDAVRVEPVWRLEGDALD